MLLFVLLWAAACAAPVALLAVEVNDQDANATLVSLNPSSGATSPVAAWGGLNGGCIGGHTVRRFAGGLALITVDDSLQTYLTTTDALGRPTGSWPEPPLDTLEVAGGALWTVVTATSKPRNHTVARVSSGGSLHRTTASWPETLFFLPGVSCASATTLYLYGVDGTNLLCAATLAATGAKVLPSRAMPSFIDNISALEFDAAHNRVLALGNNGQGALQLYAFDPVTLNFTGTLVTFASQWGGTTGASALVGGTLYFSAINGDGAMFLLSVAANGKVGAAVALDSIVASLLAPAAPAVVPMSPAAIAARTSTWRSAARVAQRIPAALPKSYDFRLQYPHCVSSILDQGDCGSCWAFASTEVLSDRYCVATGKRVQLSPQYALDCEAHLGCAVGSMPEHAWNYLEHTGTTLLNCTAYTGNYTVECATKCDNGSPATMYRASSYGQVGDFIDPSRHVATIMTALLEEGPLDATFVLYPDFYAYAAGEVYEHRHGIVPDGLHSVKIMGYGISNSSVPYWLVQNSWGESWGDHGFFMIKRGVDECMFESQVFAGKPRV